MNKIILMLGHQSKVGKDTLADELVKRAGFKKIAFADKLKEFASDLFSIPLQEFYDEVLKNEIAEGFDKTRRQILQHLSPTIFQVDNLVWVKHVIVKLGNADRIVITDFRFPQEIEKLKEYASQNGYTLINCKLIRDGVPEFSGSNDISEIALRDYPWQHKIVNNGSIDDLYWKGLDILHLGGIDVGQSCS